ncbi:flagellar motor protein MotS [Thalassobacillus sp. C254]|uniref:flagellar motor protein MotS n=1 Tax=Thalassobacillus sp. C254 TaxID=1225341 RepID=UPI0006D08F9D|nr:flagellar motor protein MotS [Thalassobacillus sp. C254]
MRRRRQEEEEKGSPRWMTTFSDMILLVLVFFVMLFSMSVVDAQKFRSLAESFQQNDILDHQSSIIDLNDQLDESSATESEGKIEGVEDEESEGYNLESLLEEVEQYLGDNDLDEVITARQEERGVVLTLQERLLFETGEADIIEDAAPFLKKVGTLLTSLPNEVTVEGHTDNRPISTYRYPSNWELSGARASSVIRHILQENELDDERFLAIGYGDTRPVAPNDTPENLQENRRVVIIISDPSYEE